MLGTGPIVYFDLDSKNIWTKYKGGDWTLRLNFSGAAGSTGATGVQGVQGIQGLIGPAGVTSLAMITTGVPASLTETAFLRCLLSAGSALPRTLRFNAFADFTETLNIISTATVRLRIGPTPLSGTIIAQGTVTNAKGKVAAPFMVEGRISLKTALLVTGRIAIWGDSAVPFNDIVTKPQSLVAAYNPAIDNWIEITYQTNSVSASALFTDGGIE